MIKRLKTIWKRPLKVSFRLNHMQQSSFKSSPFARPSHILSFNSSSFIRLSTPFSLDFSQEIFALSQHVCQFFLHRINFSGRALSSHSFSTQTASMLWISVSFVPSSCPRSPIKSSIKESSSSFFSRTFSRSFNFPLQFLVNFLNPFNITNFLFQISKFFGALLNFSHLWIIVSLLLLVFSFYIPQTIFLPRKVRSSTKKMIIQQISWHFNIPR